MAGAGQIAGGRFEVLDGTMRFRSGMRAIVAQASGSVVVPAGRVHRFTNGGDGTARVRVQVSPRSTWEQLLVTTAAWIVQGVMARSPRWRAAAGTASGTRPAAHVRVTQCSATWRSSLRICPRRGP
jgi:hypothetical protein